MKNSNRRKGNEEAAGLAEQNPLRPYVHQILTSSERAVLLTRGLLAFSKKQVMNPRAVSLNQVVTTVQQLVRPMIREDIKVVVHLHEADPAIWGDTIQIEQVLMNLIASGRDATSEGGVLTIRTDLLTSQGRFDEGSTNPNPWKCAVVSVCDNGTGILDAFSAPKGSEGPLHQRLSHVYGIVKEHNGSVNVVTERGKGTTVKLYLPLLPNTGVDLSRFESSGAHLGQNRL